MLAWIDVCQAFSSRSSPTSPSATVHLPSREYLHPSSTRRKGTPSSALYLFREFLSDDEEDLRAKIAIIEKKDGLDEFLKRDDRLCVVKWVCFVWVSTAAHAFSFVLWSCYRCFRLYAPFCKACKAFGIKFRKLAMERGDRINAAGEIVYPGEARFGEIEFSSNTRLCKYLEVKKFPTVLIFRGGDTEERIGEIDCKGISIERLVSEMDQVMSTSKMWGNQGFTIQRRKQCLNIKWLITRENDG